LTPQAVHKIGGYRVQGRDDATASKLREDALALEQAGADILLLATTQTSTSATSAKTVTLGQPSLSASG